MDVRAKLLGLGLDPIDAKDIVECLDIDETSESSTVSGQSVSLPIDGELTHISIGSTPERFPDEKNTVKTDSSVTDKAGLSEEWVTFSCCPSVGLHVSVQ